MELFVTFSFQLTTTNMLTDTTIQIEPVRHDWLAESTQTIFNLSSPRLPLQLSGLLSRS